MTWANHFPGLLKDKDYKYCTVEVKNVRGFSIGDGPITIWANGRAGWFEIKPAPTYQDIYDKMTEAIDLYYILSDVHTDAKAHSKGKNRKPLDAEQVFDKVYLVMQRFQLILTYIPVVYTRKGRADCSEPG